MKEKISITLDEKIIKNIDRMVDGSKVKNRSHAIELLILKNLGNNELTTALFLLGGEKKNSSSTPKALLKIQGKTVPEYLFDLFKKYKITKFIFSLGYKAEEIKNYFGDGSKFGVEIIYVVEKTPMGSAGAIKLAEKHISGPFIVTNGDEVKDIDIEDMYQFHKENNAQVTVALTTVNDPLNYGVVSMKRNKILNFTEKPRKEAQSNLINSGLSIWEPSVLKAIPENFSSYEKNIFPKLAKEEGLFGYIFEGKWIDTEMRMKQDNIRVK